MRYLLDTHVWVWWNAEPQKLSPAVIKLIEDPQEYDELLISAITPWELCKLVEKRRLTLAYSTQAWLKRALDMPSLRIVPLTVDISLESTQLPAPFHDDPADQIIVATARHEGATIITKDRLIQQYEHVKSYW